MPAGLPTVSQVATLLRARTKTSMGAELGTFNTDTRPTDIEVTDLIEIAADEVYASVGPYASVPASMQDSAERFVSVRAAMLIELSYFPEQVRAERSPYDRLRDLYEDGLPRLVEAVREAKRSDGESDAGDAMLPHYAFPADCGGMIGWGTGW